MSVISTCPVHGGVVFRRCFFFPVCDCDPCVEAVLLCVGVYG